MIRVFVADDHALVRCGIKQVLGGSSEIEIVGEATDGRQVLDALPRARWDVLVLDLALPKVNGPEVLRRVRTERPELPVVVVSMYPEVPYGKRMRQAGARAYVSKERPPGELVAAVIAVARGTPPPPPILPGSSAQAAHEALSRREYQVLMLLLQGHAVADIAAELDVHSCTVSNHLAKLRAKLGVRSVAELVRYALSAGLVDRPPTGG